MNLSQAGIYTTNPIVLAFPATAASAPPHPHDTVARHPHTTRPHDTPTPQTGSDAVAEEQRRRERDNFYAEEENSSMRGSSGFLLD